MRFKKSIILFVTAILISGLALVHTASAGIIGDCTMTGYVYMSNYGTQLSTAESGNDYFLAQPLTYDFMGGDMWGYSYLKFDNLSDATVESAYLVLDLLGVGGMAVTDATEAYPATLDIYNPGDVDVVDIHGVDVADLDDSKLLRAVVRDELLKGETIVDRVTMPSNGTYYIDITEIYNAWVEGEIDNNGLVLASNSPNVLEAQGYLGAVGAKFASFNSEYGNAPYISTVPVPGAVWLLGSGFLGIVGLRRLRNK
jgi:hypothetical protein